MNRGRRRARVRPLLLALALLGGCEGGDPSASSPPASEAGDTSTRGGRPVLGSGLDYVGVEACIRCHAPEHERWRGSHHDLAMQPATPETVLGDFDDARFTYFDVTSTFFRRDGGFFVRTDGPDGVLRDYEIAYTFGVVPLQQYLVPLPGGRLQALGIAWDSRPADAGGQRWFHLYPDERVAPGDPLHWTGIQQNWNFMCAECHSTHLEKHYRAEEERYETRWAEIDVSCEACHGPGSLHVAWAEAVEQGHTPQEVPDQGLPFRLGEGEETRWIFQPGSAIARRSRPLESRVEVELCARCHSRRSLLSERYVHGAPLLDTHRLALLDPGVYHADGQILDEVYAYGSFLQSRMYAAGVTCGDCHDPHDLSVLGGRDAVCARCHRPETYVAVEHHFHQPGTPGSACVDCHMLSRTYMGVDVRYDHSFRVPRPDLSVRLGVPDACTDCHADRGAQWSAEAVAEWYGPGRRAEAHFGEVIHAGREGVPGAERALAGLALDATQPAIARATALRLLRGGPAPPSADAVARSLRDQDPLVRMAALEASEVLEPGVRLRLAKGLLRDPVRAVRIEAARGLLSVPPELWSPSDRVALADALAEYREAQLASAERPEAHLNLGGMHAQLGEYADAEREYETALRLDPTFVPAYVNLADLDRLESRDDDGERTLRQALELAPGSAEVHHALGLLQVRRRRLDQAIESLGRAAELAPDQARYAYVYGVALHSAGQGDHALAVLGRAHDRHPGDRDILLALATLSRDRGDWGAARTHARALAGLSPEDPAVRSLLEQLEGGATIE